MRRADPALKITPQQRAALDILNRAGVSDLHEVTARTRFSLVDRNMIQAIGGTHRLQSVRYAMTPTGRDALAQDCDIVRRVRR